MPLFQPDTTYAYVKSRRSAPKSLAIVDEGVVAGTLPELAGDIDGTATTGGIIAGTLPSVTAALVGAGTTSGALAGTLPTLAGGIAAMATGSGLIAGTLPSALASLAGVATGAGALAGALPELAGALSGEGGATGVVAGVLPVVVGEADGLLLSQGSMAGALPELAGALTGVVETEESLLLGVLPALAGELESVATGSGTLATVIPFPTVTLVAVASSVGDIDGDLPALTGELAGIGQEPGAGGLFVVLPAMLSTTGLGSVMNELDRQRRATARFIAASPTTIALFPNPEQRTPSGGVMLVEGVPRPLQQFRVIPMSHTERPFDSSSGVAGAAGGQQRKYDMTLLAEWDTVVRENDFWYDDNGTKYVVDALVPFNGYERKALVMAYGRRAQVVA